MMSFEIIYKLIGKTGFHLDPSLKAKDKFYIITRRLFLLLKGLFIGKLFFKKAEGFIFIGKRFNGVHKWKISAGKTLSIGSDVTLNALSLNGINFGNNCTLKDGVTIDCCGILSSVGDGIYIGDNVGISEQTLIQVRGRVEIHQDVIIGPGVKIISENHNFKEQKKIIRIQGTTRKGIIIESGSWIGANAVILDGVKLGKNTVVAAGAIVNKDTGEGDLVGGIPAKNLSSK